MSKKMMVLALAVACAALFALPAVASAQTWHIDKTSSFTISGSGGTLTSAAGGNISCTLTTGSGSFSTTTEGTIKLLFHGCKGPLGVSCTSPSHSTGTITANAIFDAIMVATNKPAILLTPDNGSTEPTAGVGKLFTEFSCLGLVVKVFGKGVIGTLSPSVCSETTATSTSTFASSALATQEDMTYTGNTFDLKSTITGSHPTASLDGSGLLTLPEARKITCTH